MYISKFVEKIQRNEELSSITANPIEAEANVLAILGEDLSQIHLHALVRQAQAMIIFKVINQSNAMLAIFGIITI